MATATIESKLDALLLEMAEIKRRLAATSPVVGGVYSSSSVSNVLTVYVEKRNQDGVETLCHMCDRVSDSTVSYELPWVRFRGRIVNIEKFVSENSSRPTPKFRIWLDIGEQKLSLPNGDEREIKIVGLSMGFTTACARNIANALLSIDSDRLASEVFTITLDGGDRIEQWNDPMAKASAVLASVFGSDGFIKPEQKYQDASERLVAIAQRVFAKTQDKSTSELSEAAANEIVAEEKAIASQLPDSGPLSPVGSAGKVRLWKFTEGLGYKDPEERKAIIRGSIQKYLKKEVDLSKVFSEITESDMNGIRNWAIAIALHHTGGLRSPEEALPDIVEHTATSCDEEALDWYQRSLF